MSETKQQWRKEWVNGSAKQIDFPNGGHVIKVSINEDDISKLRKITSEKTGKTFLQLELGSKPEKDEWGNTHNLSSSFPPDEEKQEDSKDKKSEDAPW